MIFLEQITNQILAEEGQILLSLSDLGITWEKLERLFIGTFEQSKNYINIYDWTNEIVSNTPKKTNYTHIKHITYNAYNNMQRFMPDLPGQYWEFNPYTKNLSSLINTNFSLEVGKNATIGQLNFDIELKNIKNGKRVPFMLPTTPVTEPILINTPQSLDTFDVIGKEVQYSSIQNNSYLDNSKNCPCNNSNVSYGIELNGDVQGSIDTDTLKGYIVFSKDYDSATITFLSKYVAIKELDMSCELFYTWYKSNLLIMLGSLKSQIDLNSSGLPFDFNADGLLERGKELRSKVDELKTTKSHWSNF